MWVSIGRTNHSLTLSESAVVASMNLVHPPGSSRLLTQRSHTTSPGPFKHAEVLRPRILSSLVATPNPTSSSPHHQQHGRSSSSIVSRGVSGDYAPSAPEIPQNTPERMGEAARKALTRATRAMTRYGWISFWTQLTLSVVSAVILLFSVAFTSQSGPRASLYLTLVGILAGTVP